MADVADRADELRRRAEELKSQLDKYYSGLDAEQRAGAPEESPYVRERQDELDYVNQELSKLSAPASSMASPPPSSSASPSVPPPPSEPPSPSEDPMGIALRAGRLVSLPTILRARAVDSQAHGYVSENLGKFLAAATLLAMQRVSARPAIVEAGDLLQAILYEAARDRERGEEVWHGRLWRFVESIGDVSKLVGEALLTPSVFGGEVPDDALAGQSLMEVLTQAADYRRLVNRKWHEIGVRHAFTAILMSQAGRLAMHEVGLFQRGFGAFRDAYAGYVVESGVGYYEDSLEAWHVIADVLRGIVWYPPGRDRTKVASDNATVEDRFGAKADADALAELITLESAGTPMAIGIFGHWGAGKSTLMRLVQKSVDELTAAERALRVVDPKDDRDGDLRRVANVVQIRFNAWTYADSENLWASLTAEFFDQLAARGADDWVRNQRGLRIVQEIAGRVAEERKVAAKSEDRITQARRALAQAQDALRVAEDRRGDIDNVAAVEALTSQLDGALGGKNPGRDPLLTGLSALGVDAAALGARAPSHFQSAAERERCKAEMASAFSRTVLDFARAPGDVSRLMRSLPHLLRPRAWMSWRNPSGLMVLFGGLIVLAVVLALSFGRGLDAWIANLRSGVWWGIAVTVVGAAHFFVRSIVPLLRLLNDFEERRARKAAEVEKEVEERQKQVRDCADQLAELNNARERAMVFATTYEQAARGESPAMALQYLLRESADLNAVRSRLGFLATVRRCFEHLEDLVRQSRAGAPGKDGQPSTGIPRIDRIVLYIDDLDRCSEAKVVQVLEAVHLLLAFEFFVVIVAVDPRWLRLALASHYAKQLAPVDDGRPDLLRPTVSDYVEKIFQIPFLVRSLSEDEHAGYRSFLDDLVAGQVARAAPGKEGGGAAVSLPADGRLAGGIVSVQAPAGYKSPGERGDAERKLLLSEDEVALLRDLGPLAAKSPRAVKRMMNVYRLMRVRLSGQTLEGFVNGAGGAPARFHAVAFVLACEVGLHPLTVTAMERVAALATTAGPSILGCPATSASTPFADALDDAWLDGEQANDRMEKPTPRSEEVGVVRALAEALVAEGKVGVVSAALGQVTTVRGGGPPLSAAELVKAFGEVRRYSFRS